MGNVVVAGPNKASIISGPNGMRILVGACGFQKWFIEDHKKLNLELRTIPIVCSGAETTKGVQVNVTAVAQIKVRARNADGVVDTIAIQRAAQHFLGVQQSHIDEAIQQTMEGHQRQILGTLTVEEIYKDRAAFSEKIREHVTADLTAMGFELVSYTMTQIGDEAGYMHALGQTQTAMVKREAAEGTARNESEAKKKVAVYESEAEIAAAEATREAHVSVNLQKQQEAESDRDLNLKRAAYAAEVNTAKAIAEAATRIEKAKQDQVVVRETAQQESERARVAIEIAERMAEKKKRQLEGDSGARLLEQENDAKAIRVLAAAEAARIQAMGDAEAAAIAAKGGAEAAVLEKKADAYKRYGEAAIVQMIVERLPEMCKNMAAPLASTGNLVFVSSDGSGPSQLTADISKMLATVPDAVQGLTGVDLRQAMQKLAGQGGGSRAKRGGQEAEL
jgi:flotillin